MSSPNRLLAPFLFAVLLVATLAAFVLVEDERDHPKIIENDTVKPRYTEVCPAVLPSEMSVRFTITRGEAHATVVVVDDQGRLVKTLADDVELADDSTQRYKWDATDADGKPVPAGRYRIRLRLADLDRDLPLPSTCVAGAPAVRP